MQHETNQTTTGSYKKYSSVACAYEDMVRYVSEIINSDNTLSILKSQSLIWNINACERGVKEHCLSEYDKSHYKAIIKNMQSMANIITEKFN